jgi:acetyl-CoA carboxylase biotin carboxylase subunit
MFKRILIANRGEIAIRIAKAAKKLKIETVMVYSQADAKLPHLKYADKTVCIGSSQSSQSYLNMEAILQAAIQNYCQAIHPGYGFLSENEIFAALCNQASVSFIGPTAKAISCMGDKANARQKMQEAGLEIIPGTKTTLSHVQEAEEKALEFGFPVLLKATAGGGGRGMRVCHNIAELKKNFAEASLEAEKAFGNPALYMEKYIQKGRHIEFQILADHFGNAIHLGERECSLQRRHQKLMEESPCSIMTDEKRNALGQKIVNAIGKVGYQNAGTVELLMDQDQNLYFMEMNARLQVEHPVSEMITGIDIVEEQFKIAANHKLQYSQKDVHFRGHAIECRINAENPKENFLPSPGKITRFQVPENVGKIRIDTFVEEGCTISPFYDSLICKLIAWGETRKEAIGVLKNALQNFVIQGVFTTIPYALKILDNPSFISGNYHTKTLEEI